MAAPLHVIVAGYAISSSFLTIANKYAVGVFPFPAFLTMLQYLTSFLFAGCLAILQSRTNKDMHEKVIGHKGWFDVGVFYRFFPAAAVYFLAIFTNTKMLQYANVETFITFRSSTPLLVAIVDSLFMNRPWPARSTFASLAVILVGAVTYMITDSNYTVRAYSWAFAYLVVITFDMIYIKHVVTHIGLPTWGLVYYNNLTAFIISPPVLWLMGEFREASAQSAEQWHSQAMPVLLSCAFGIAISFFGFSCRCSLSPTAFTVLGVMCKIITVVVNVFIWDKHATPVGIGALLVCIVGGVAYEQTVKRARAAAAAGATAEDIKGTRFLDELRSVVQGTLVNLRMRFPLLQAFIAQAKIGRKEHMEGADDEDSEGKANEKV